MLFIRHRAKLFGSGALAPQKEDEDRATFPSFARTLVYNPTSHYYFFIKNKQNPQLYSIMNTHS